MLRRVLLSVCVAPLIAVRMSTSAQFHEIPKMMSFISRTQGDFSLTAEGGQTVTGTYTFDTATGDIKVKGQVIGTFFCEPSESMTLPLGSKANKVLPSISVVSSEVMKEIQNPANSDAYFVLPSQLNGAEYPSYNDVVTEVDEYKWDNTGGPRGQLAVHPAAAQFVLDNAASDQNVDGICAVDELLRKAEELGAGFELKNGYLKLPLPKNAKDEAWALNILQTSLTSLRPLVMFNVPASGLTPSKRKFSTAKHKVNLVYASAVPVNSYLNRAPTEAQEQFHFRAAEAVLFAQYLAALKTAASRATPSAPTVVYFMPLGGGVFNNPWDSIAWAMSSAVEALSDDELKRVDIYALAWEGSSMEEQTLKTQLQTLGKLRNSKL